MSPEIKEQIDRRERIFEQIKDLLIEALKLDRTSLELDPDTPLFGSGLGLDSVDAVEIMVALETEFGVVLDEDQSIRALRTINSLVDSILNGNE